MKSLLERKIELAILKVQREMMRQFITSDSYREHCMDLKTTADEEGLPVKQFFYELIQREEQYEATQFPDLAKQFSLQGYDKGIDHYDIDKALQDKFGNEVDTDSESGGFYAYCSETALERVEAFLKLRFPGLDFTSKEREGKKAVFKYERDAKAFLEEQGIEVQHPLQETFDKLKEIEKLKAELKEKVRAINSDMMGVANSESLSQMQKVDDEVKNKVIELYVEAIEENTLPKEGDDEDNIAYKKLLKESNLELCEEYKNQEWYALKRMTGMLMFQTEGGGTQRIFRNKIKEHFKDDLTSIV